MKKIIQIYKQQILPTVIPDYLTISTISQSEFKLNCSGKTF